MRRRDFIRVIAGSSATWPLVARGQLSTRRPLIAVLTAITKENNSPLNALVQGLKEFGYVDGVNVDIVYRFAEGHLDRFPVLAAELVGLRPDVIVATVTPSGNERADDIHSNCLSPTRRCHQPRVNRQ